MNGCFGLFRIAWSLPDKNGGVSETSSNPQVPVSEARSTSNPAAVNASYGCRASTKNTPVLWPPGSMAPLKLETAIRALRGRFFAIAFLLNWLWIGFLNDRFYSLELLAVQPFEYADRAAGTWPTTAPILPWCSRLRAHVPSSFWTLSSLSTAAVALPGLRHPSQDF